MRRLIEGESAVKKRESSPVSDIGTKKNCRTNSHLSLVGSHHVFTSSPQANVYPAKPLKRHFNVITSTKDIN